MQPSQPKIGKRRLKAGETLLKPNDRILSMFIIQDGCISVCGTRTGKIVEIARLFSPASLGEEEVFGTAHWSLTAIAVRDTTVLEIPLEIIRAHLQASKPELPPILRALSDRSKAVFTELRSLKANAEVAPCPGESTAKLFGVIFHVAMILSGAEKGAQEAKCVDWTALKRYAREVFDEPAWRLEDGLIILAKLGYARIDGNQVDFTELGHIEAFFEYYGNYHFKGGHEDLLKTNSKSTKVTEELLKIARAYPVDRGGNVHLPYTETMEAMKKGLGSGFSADQLFRLEAKGLFIKRAAGEDGGKLSFYKPDFEQMLLNWGLLREIEAWNENGFIEPAPGFTVPSSGDRDAEPDAAADRKRWAKLLSDWKPAVNASGIPKLRTGERKQGEVWCEICLSPLSSGQKHCEVCGAQAGEAA